MCQFGHQQLANAANVSAENGNKRNALFDRATY